VPCRPPRGRPDPTDGQADLPPKVHVSCFESSLLAVRH